MINALKKNQTVKDPVKSKKNQLLANLAGIIAGIAIGIIKNKYPDLALGGLEDYLTEVVIVLLGGINAYFIPATTKSIGIK